MDEPPPPDTQEKLLRLCSIYTQGGYHDDNDTRGHHDISKPVYTLQNLKERLSRDSNSAHGLGPGPSLSNHSASSIRGLPTEDLQEKLSPSVLEERQAALRGSPWQVCTGERVITSCWNNGLMFMLEHWAYVDFTLHSFMLFGQCS